MSVTLSELTSASLATLEDIYTSEAPLEVPRGFFRGRVLQRVDSAGVRRLGNRLLVSLGFERQRFGVDFDRRLWTFWHRRVALGRFEPRVQASRWREAQVVGLHYQTSRVPRFLRRHLYDEVKPLGPDLALGLGGVNAERGEGDLFFFVLARP